MPVTVACNGAYTRCTQPTPALHTRCNTGMHVMVACDVLGLQERCETLAKELLAVDSRLQACMDVAALRKAGMWPWQGTASSHAERCVLDVAGSQGYSTEAAACPAHAPSVQGCVAHVAHGCEYCCIYLCTCVQACSTLLPQARCWRRSWPAAPILIQHSTA